MGIGFNCFLIFCSLGLLVSGKPLEFGQNDVNDLNQNDDNSFDITITIIPQSAIGDLNPPAGKTPITPSNNNSSVGRNQNQVVKPERNYADTQTVTQPKENTALQLYSNDKPGSTVTPDNTDNTIIATPSSTSQKQDENTQSSANLGQQPIHSTHSEENEPTSNQGPIIILFDTSNSTGEDADKQQNQNQDQPPSNDNEQNSNQCGVQITATPDESQPKLQLTQVTSSQILYRLNLQYEKMLQEKGASNVQDYESLQLFLSKMLQVSETETVDTDKNLVTITYAAYYSTEYAYTFGLCKLKNLTGSTDPKTDDCSQVVHLFHKFSILYKKVITESITGNGARLSQNDQNNTGNPNETSTNENQQSNKLNEGDVLKDDNIFKNMNLEKDLSGYNDTEYINRSRLESNTTDQFDRFKEEKTAGSTYSEETKGKYANLSTNMLSEITPLSSNNGNDSLTAAKRHIKSANMSKTKTEANTVGRLTTDQMVIDTNKSNQGMKMQKILNETFQNMDDGDNNDIGGNIKNAKSQVVRKGYSEIVEENIQDENKKVTYITPQSEDGQFTFVQAVGNLLKYIETLDTFINNMDENVDNEKNKPGSQGKELYSMMYESVYQQTVTYRRYLKNYFNNVNVDKGVPSSCDDIETGNAASGEKMLELTITRFMWLKSVESGQLQLPNTSTKTENQDSPLQLLWRIEEARFYQSYVAKMGSNVPFMGHLPYPDFTVEIDQNNPTGVDVHFYLEK